MLKCRFKDSKDEILVNFSSSGNVVTLKGPVPHDTSGFYLSRQTYNDNWDYTGYKTIYRVLDDGIQFSNDGSVYVEPTKDITVRLIWDDASDIMKLRPESVEVILEGLATVVLSEDNNWESTFSNIPVDNDYPVFINDILGYSIVVDRYSIVAHTDYPVPEDVTVDDLSNAIAELTDLIVDINQDMIDTQEAVVEIYEMMEE